MNKHYHQKLIKELMALISDMVSGSVIEQRDDDRLIRRVLKRIGLALDTFSDINEKNKLNTFAKIICKDIPLCDSCRLNCYCDYYSLGPRIKQMPEYERPREKFILKGERNLSTEELLAIILRTGSQKRTAIELAKELMRKFKNVSNLSSARIDELSMINGIGKVKAVQIKAAIELGRRCIKNPLTYGSTITSPQDIYENYKNKYIGQKRESFFAILLDSKNRVIKDVEISLGTLTDTVVMPREAFTEAIKESSAGIIFLHNHPSGSKEASQEDIKTTKRLKETSELIGIKMLDHIIIAEDGYTSFAELKLL